MKIQLNDMPIYNYGCEAIVRGTVEILSRVFGGDLHYFFPERYPSYSKKRFSDIDNLTIVPHSLFRAGIRFLSRKLGLPWYNVLRFNTAELKSSDCVLSIGGDIYSLSTGDIPLNVVGLGEYCYKKNIPYIIWGATVGPFEDRPDRLPMIIEHLRKATLILVRDTASMDYLEGRSIKENVKRVADPAFLMRPESCDITRFLPKEKEHPILGLNFSPLARRYYPDKEQFVNEIVKTCEMAIKKFDISIVLVPHVFAPFEFESYDDLQFLLRVYEGIDDKLKDHLGVVSEDIGSPRIKYLISQLNYYAGARMHSTIAAFSMNVPTISLAYSMKAEGLNQDLFGHKDWVLKIPDFTAERFCEKLQRLINEKDQVKSGLETKIPEMQKMSMIAGEYLRNALLVRHQ